MRWFHSLIVNRREVEIKRTSECVAIIWIPISMCINFIAFGIIIAHMLCIPENFQLLKYAAYLIAHSNEITSNIRAWPVVFWNATQNLECYWRGKKEENPLTFFLKMYLHSLEVITFHHHRKKYTIRISLIKCMATANGDTWWAFFRGKHLHFFHLSKVELCVMILKDWTKKRKKYHANGSTDRL